MIAKIGRGANLIGALSYNQLKVDNEIGEILYLNNMAETWNGKYTVHQLARSFEPYLLANNKTEKMVLHISLNPDPKDQVSDEKFKHMAQEYMKEMGYGNQPYVVFKHTDIDRSHIHIVSVCIDEYGKKISDTYEKRRSMKVCRDLEREFGLLPATEKEHTQNDKIFHPVDYQKGDIKSQIASVVRHLPKYYSFQSLGEYNALLSLFNICTEEVKGQLQGADKQGIVYFALNENGEKCSNTFKASLFGKGAGHDMLQQHFKTSAVSIQKETGIDILKNTVELAMHTANDEITFKKELLDGGINTVVRRSAEGRVYGITFIDHNAKLVSNGSRLGKEFSAGIFNEWWNNNRKPEIISPKQKPTIKQDLPGNSSAEDTRQNIFEFLMKDDYHSNSYVPEFIEGVGGLLPEIQGEDFEELDFENQMKRKIRKKKR